MTAQQPKPELGEVLLHYGVALDISRMNQKVHCPVHEDSVQSCSVNLDEQLFKCFACGKQGDSWTLIMEREGMDFATAVRFAKETADFSSSGVPEADVSRVPGLLGRSRPGRRSSSSGSFRPSFRSNLGA